MTLIAFFFLVVSSIAYCTGLPRLSAMRKHCLDAGIHTLCAVREWKKNSWTGSC